jgi:protein-disulfide isomerase
MIWAAAGMRQQLLDKYGDKLRFVWADFPVITPESPKAAEAGRCAYDQGKFWEYQDYLYTHYEGIEVAYLKLYAKRLGLDQAQFDRCLDSGVKEAEVDLDFKDAMIRSFAGTPTFLINDKVVINGMAPMDKFSAIIDPILAQEH